MQSELAKGDAIVTIGGLHGTIESVDETKIVIKSGGSHLTFDRNAIREVVKTNGRPCMKCAGPFSYFALTYLHRKYHRVYSPPLMLIDIVIVSSIRFEKSLNS